MKKKCIVLFLSGIMCLSSGSHIVLASDDYPRGTVVETSLGAGKVYDTGSGSGNIDLYTDW